MCEPYPSSQERRYANYLNVGYNGFEFLLDFGQQDEGNAAVPHTRIITTPLYARAYFEVLRKSLEDYESKYGQIMQDRPK